MSHPQYGQPRSMVVQYLGSLSGTRTWHLFEVPRKEGDDGVLLMNAVDVAKLVISEFYP